MREPNDRLRVHDTQAEPNQQVAPLTRRPANLLEQNVRDAQIAYRLISGSFTRLLLAFRKTLTEQQDRDLLELLDEASDRADAFRELMLSDIARHFPLLSPGLSTIGQHICEKDAEHDDFSKCCTGRGEYAAVQQLPPAVPIYLRREVAHE